jgi:hypothetical protein
LHAAAVADLEHQRVKEHHRIHVIQGSLLPGSRIVHDRVGDPADQIPTNMHPVDLGDVRLDIPRRQPPGIQGQDLVVKALKAPLALLDDLRFKRAVTIPRRVDRNPAVLGDQRLRCRPVARIA